MKNEKIQYIAMGASFGTDEMSKQKEVKEEPVYLDAKELSRRINAAARKIRMLNKEE